MKQLILLMTQNMVWLVMSKANYLMLKRLEEKLEQGKLLLMEEQEVQELLLAVIKRLEMEESMVSMEWKTF